MQFVKGKNETGTTVILDDTSFVDCKFTNCTLLYSGGDFAWQNTTFANCTLGLQGPAQRTAGILQHFGWKPPQPGQPLPQPQGTIH